MYVCTYVMYTHTHVRCVHAHTMTVCVITCNGSVYVVNIIPLLMSVSVTQPAWFGLLKWTQSKMLSSSVISRTLLAKQRFNLEMAKTFHLYVSPRNST